MVEHLCGRPVAAAHWFERNRSACGPAALYTEDYDVHQRQLRGNLPQAFVHAGLLECAVTLSRDVSLGGGAFILCGVLCGLMRRSRWPYLSSS